MIAGAWSGHIGTSFSSLEIMSWLFLNELRDLDKGPDACDIFFSSKGHDAPALYTVLIGLGLLPADKLHQLRRLHGLPGHPHVETPYIQANTGSLGMGISKAKGMALANRLAGVERRVFVLTGDGELQEGQFWESLGSAANRGLGEIVAIVDHNKIQSDTWVERRQPPRRPRGEVPRVRLARRAAATATTSRRSSARSARSTTSTDRPKVDHRRHGQGQGRVSFMEGPAMKAGELYGYHSGAPGEQQYTAGLAELLAAGERACSRELGLGAVRTETRMRNPRREPRQTDNLSPPTSARCVAQARAASASDRARRRPGQGLRAGRRSRSAFPSASSSAASPSRTWCRWPAAWRAAACCRSCTRSPASSPRGRTSRSTTSAARARRSSTSARWPACCPAGRATRTSRCATSRRSARCRTWCWPSRASRPRSARCRLRWSTRAATASYLRLVSVKWPMPFAYPAHHAVEVGKGWVVRDGADAVVFGYGPWLLANAFEAAEEIEKRPAPASGWSTCRG